MLKSTFTSYVGLTAGLTLVMVVTSGLIAIMSISQDQPATPIFFTILFTVTIGYMLIWLIFSELRTKAIKIWIDQTTIEKKSYLGLGRKRTYQFSEVDGYKTSIMHSKIGTYEYLYIMIGNRKVVKLSEFYHANYRQMRSAIMRSNIKNLGVEQWSLIREASEIFQ